MKLTPLVLALASSLLFFQQAESGPKAPELGKPAPGFRLNDQTGKAVRIGGKSETWTVVAFYPKAMTPG